MEIFSAKDSSQNRRENIKHRVENRCLKIRQHQINLPYCVTGIVIMELLGKHFHLFFKNRLRKSPWLELSLEPTLCKIRMRVGLRGNMISKCFYVKQEYLDFTYQYSKTHFSTQYSMFNYLFFSWYFNHQCSTILVQKVKYH